MLFRSAAHLAADLHSNAEVVRGAAVDRQEGVQTLSIVARPSCQGPSERPSPGSVDGEKGAAVRCSLVYPGGHFATRPRCGWPVDERPLGLVNVSPLRGGGAPHDPDVARSVQGCVALAAPLFSHVAPDREKNGPRDRRCPKRSRSGRSLHGEQSPWGAPRNGVSRSLTSSSFGGSPPSKGDFRSWAVVPTTVSGRSGCSTWSVVVLVETSVAEVVRAHAALKAHAKSVRTRV